MKVPQAIQSYQEYHSINSKKYMDEIIFISFNPRNRIMLELMARGAMRIGEVLKIRPIYVQDHKITLPEPKSGNEKV